LPATTLINDNSDEKPRHLPPIGYLNMQHQQLS